MLWSPKIAVGFHYHYPLRLGWGLGDDIPWSQHLVISFNCSEAGTARADCAAVHRLTMALLQLPMHSLCVCVCVCEWVVAMESIR